MSAVLFTDKRAQTMDGFGWNFLLNPVLNYVGYF
jgi:hypothetical protein